MRSYSTIVASRATLATMLAAMIEAQVRSPRTTAIWGSGASGTSHASTSRYSARIFSPATAPAVARWRARVSPRLSTCAWSTAHTETATAFRRMTRSSRSRPGAVGARATSPASGRGSLRFRLFAFLGFGRFGLFLSRFGFGAERGATLADAGALAHLAAQVVQPRLADIAVTQHVDLLDA